MCFGDHEKGGAPLSLLFPPSFKAREIIDPPNDINQPTRFTIDYHTGAAEVGGAALMQQAACFGPVADKSGDVAILVFVFFPLASSVLSIQEAHVYLWALEVVFLLRQ